MSFQLIGGGILEKPEKIKTNKHGQQVKRQEKYQPPERL
jgi:hypothetical protein